MKSIIKGNKYSKDAIAFLGNKYLIGNGYLGIRGTMEEYRKENMPALNLAGIYDKVGDAWRESVNAPNPLYTYIIVDGEKLVLPESEPLEFSQELDIKTGIHKRRTVWKTQKGLVEINCERFASMNCQHAVCMKYSFSADYDCKAQIITGIDADVWDINGPHFVKAEVLDDEIICTTGEQSINVSVCEKVLIPFEANISNVKEALSEVKVIEFSAKQSEIYEIEKVALVSASRDTLKVDRDDINISYSEHKEKHIKKWNDIWNISWVEIDGDDEGEFALNYSIYHLNCIAPRNLENISIPARGLSGQVYKGAVFWDTEMFMIDYYIHTEPSVAKTLIDYRISTLEGAKKKAREYGLDGAYYPWESHEGGIEACSDYNITDVFTKRPMRTFFRDKQYHVSAAIVYAVVKYIKATGDKEVLKNGAATMIIECAKLYRSLLYKKADSKKYEILDVVGPDEYHERVNNNAYTNKMAQFVFKTAAELIERAKNGEDLGISEEYDLAKLEDMFCDSYENIFIRVPDENGLIEQFDGYFKREDVSVDTVRSRLLDPKEYWGGAYGVASDTQVLKQADVVAMLSIFKDDYSTDIMKKNWEYYEPRTEHGSSLSACMYSLVACNIGEPDSAYKFFMKSAAADLNEGAKQWMGLIYIGGTHPASEGGAWIVAINGFAGISIEEGKLICNPKLPKKWKSMKFKLMFKNKLYEIKATCDGASVKEV